MSEEQKKYKISSDPETRTEDEYYFRPHADRCTAAMIDLEHSDILCNMGKAVEKDYGGKIWAQIVCVGPNFEGFEIGDFISVLPQFSISHRSGMNLLKNHEWYGMHLITVSGHDIWEHMKPPKGCKIHLTDIYKKDREAEEAREIARNMRSGGGQTVTLK